MINIEVINHVIVLAENFAEAHDNCIEIFNSWFFVNRPYKGTDEKVKLALLDSASKQLEEYLSGVDTNTLFDMDELVYIGRDDEYEYDASGQAREDIIHDLCAKVPLADYLISGLEKLKNNPDKHIRIVF